VNQLLSGSFFPDDWIDVIPQQGRGLIKQEVKRPKIIVGMSITPTTIRSFPTSARIFPVIVDIGCNQTFEIDERHLVLWNGTNKRHFDLLQHRQRVGKRGYDIRCANIWLHLDPYTGPRFKGSKPPFLLSGSDEIVVMDPSTSDPDPRFPLLGLKAIKDSNLIVVVNGAASHFDIYEA
jgi:hypothetical protein